MNVCSWLTGTSLSLWWKWRDISGFSFQGSFSISGKGYVHVHVLFDWAWSGWTGKYLARGPDVRTKRYAVWSSRLREKYFLIRPNSVNRHFIMWPLRKILCQLNVLTLEFLQKSRIRTGLDSSFWTGSRQPVRPCSCQLSVWFSMGLRARCRTGHLINMLNDDETTYFYHLKKTLVDLLNVISLQYEERMRIQKAGGTVR